jgi:hypothetical protein
MGVRMACERVCDCCLFECLCVCAPHACIRMRMHGLWLFVYTCERVWTHARVYVCVCVCVCVCACVCVCVQVRAHMRRVIQFYARIEAIQHACSAPFQSRSASPPAACNMPCPAPVRQTPACPGSVWQAAGHGASAARRARPHLGVGLPVALPQPERFYHVVVDGDGVRRVGRHGRAPVGYERQWGGGRCEREGHEGEGGCQGRQAGRARGHGCLGFAGRLC